MHGQLWIKLAETADKLLGALIHLVLLLVVIWLLGFTSCLLFRSGQLVWRLFFQESW